MYVKEVNTNYSHLVPLDNTAAEQSAATYETEWNQMHTVLI